MSEIHHSAKIKSEVVDEPAGSGTSTSIDSAKAPRGLPVKYLPRLLARKLSIGVGEKLYKIPTFDIILHSLPVKVEEDDDEDEDEPKSSKRRKRALSDTETSSNDSDTETEEESSSSSCSYDSLDSWSEDSVVHDEHVFNESDDDDFRPHSSTIRTRSRIVTRSTKKESKTKKGAMKRPKRMLTRNTRRGANRIVSSSSDEDDDEHDENQEEADTLGRRKTRSKNVMSPAQRKKLAENQRRLTRRYIKRHNIVLDDVQMKNMESESESDQEYSPRQSKEWFEKNKKSQKPKPLSNVTRKDVKEISQIPSGRDVIRAKRSRKTSKSVPQTKKVRFMDQLEQPPKLTPNKTAPPEPNSTEEFDEPPALIAQANAPSGITAITKPKIWSQDPFTASQEKQTKTETYNTHITVADADNEESATPLVTKKGGSLWSSAVKKLDLPTSPTSSLLSWQGELPIIERVCSKAPPLQNSEAQNSSSAAGEALFPITQIDKSTEVKSSLAAGNVKSATPELFSSTGKARVISANLSAAFSAVGKEISTAKKVVSAIPLPAASAAEKGMPAAENVESAIPPPAVSTVGKGTPAAENVESTTPPPVALATGKGSPAAEKVESAIPPPAVSAGGKGTPATEKVESPTPPPAVSAAVKGTPAAEKVESTAPLPAVPGTGKATSMAQKVVSAMPLPVLSATGKATSPTPTSEQNKPTTPSAATSSQVKAAADTPTTSVATILPVTETPEPLLDDGSKSVQNGVRATERAPVHVQLSTTAPRQSSSALPSVSASRSALELLGTEEEIPHLPKNVPASTRNEAETSVTEANNVPSRQANSPPPEIIAEVRGKMCPICHKFIACANLEAHGKRRHKRSDLGPYFSYACQMCSNEEPFQTFSTLVDHVEHSHPQMLQCAPASNQNLENGGGTAGPSTSTGDSLHEHLRSLIASVQAQIAQDNKSKKIGNGRRGRPSKSPELRALMGKTSTGQGNSALTTASTSSTTTASVSTAVGPVSFQVVLSSTCKNQLFESLRNLAFPTEELTKEMLIVIKNELQLATGRILSLYQNGSGAIQGQTLSLEVRALKEEIHKITETVVTAQRLRWSDNSNQNRTNTNPQDPPSGRTGAPTPPQSAGSQQLVACPYCGYVTNTMDVLELHGLQHQVDVVFSTGLNCKMYPCVVANCDIKFNNIRQFLDHRDAGFHHGLRSGQFQVTNQSAVQGRQAQSVTARGGGSNVTNLNNAGNQITTVSTFPAVQSRQPIPRGSSGRGRGNHNGNIRTNLTMRARTPIIQRAPRPIIPAPMVTPPNRTPMMPPLTNQWLSTSRRTYPVMQTNRTRAPAMAAYTNNIASMRPPLNHVTSVHSRSNQATSMAAPTNQFMPMQNSTAGSMAPPTFPGMMTTPTNSPGIATNNFGLMTPTNNAGFMAASVNNTGMIVPPMNNTGFMAPSTNYAGIMAPPTNNTGLMAPCAGMMAPSTNNTGMIASQIGNVRLIDLLSGSTSSQFNLSGSVGWTTGHSTTLAPPTNPTAPVIWANIQSTSFAPPSNTTPSVAPPINYIESFAAPTNVASSMPHFFNPAPSSGPPSSMALPSQTPLTQLLIQSPTPQTSTNQTQLPLPVNSNPTSSIGRPDALTFHALNQQQENPVPFRPNPVDAEDDDSDFECFSCDTCNVDFATEDEAKEHLVKVHGAQKLHYFQ